MKYAGLMENDMANGEGVCVSFWAQGCPHKCLGCHNPQTWDFDNGYEIPEDIKGRIVKAISANGITRNFSILGGEPLCDENLDLILNITTAVRTAYPHIKIYIWTGYTYAELIERNDNRILEILKQINILIDGRYEQDKRDTTLPLRGSTNQNIIKLEELQNL